VKVSDDPEETSFRAYKVSRPAPAAPAKGGNFSIDWPLFLPGGLSRSLRMKRGYARRGSTLFLKGFSPEDGAQLSKELHRQKSCLACEGP